MKDIWYENNKKKIPSNIQDFLTPIALAIWIIDSGIRTNKSLKFAINSYSYKDCLFLSQILLEKYNIKTSVQSAGKPNQYVIYILKESMLSLYFIVKDHIVSSMLYKIQ
uniref:hypothetical protein n=1 Tax=Malassezia nana TaxID=180528 RepID=UPI003002C463|nr:hypothetical protein [Malassezia nana]